MGNEVGRNYVDVMAMHSDVTGSCILGVVKLHNYSKTEKFVIDVGLFQGKEQDQHNGKIMFNPDEVSCIGITHAHIDHVGQLPLLYTNGAMCKVYSSESTAKLLPYQLNDCLRVGLDTAKRKHEKPLYTQDAVDKTLAASVGCKYSEAINGDDHIKMTFFQNGHLYGASVILVQIAIPNGDEINILFSGDYSSKNVFFPVEKLPKWVRKLPLSVVIEATYGNRSTDDTDLCFEDNIMDAISNGRDVVIPAFSLGRGQEIMLLLHNMQEEGKLDKDIPILYCGKLGIRYTEQIFNKNDEFFPDARSFYPEGLQFIYTTADIVSYPSKPKIILGSAGMGGYGPMQTLIPEFIRRKALIHFTGFCAEGTLGRQLMDAQLDSSVEIAGRLVKKRADVKYTTEFSAHAKNNELIEFLQQFENLQTVLINHGTHENKKAFADKVLDEVEANDVVILSRDIGFRLNKIGLQKSLNTRFK